MDWKVSGKEKDPIKAIAMVEQEMLKMGINWPIKPFKKASESSMITEVKGVNEIRLAVENCIVRCTLARYGFPQRGSLCQTKHGLFCGLYDQISGRKSSMDIVHAGENGCMLKLKAFS
jgi:hypothetical protein